MTPLLCTSGQLREFGALPCSIRVPGGIAPTPAYGTTHGKDTRELCCDSAVRRFRRGPTDVPDPPGRGEPGARRVRRDDPGPDTESERACAAGRPAPPADRRVDGGRPRVPIADGR